MNMPILPQTIQVADKQTLLIQYKSVPVMTTEQLADFYGTDSNNIKVNHSRNSSRFVQGKHYFKVEGVDLKDFKNWVTESNSVQIGKNASSIILWTEKGAARHAKILDTDQAWDIFEQLEEVYFAVKEKSHFPALPNFTDPAEAAMAWANEYKAKQLAITERDHAIATKAEIGSKREATAVATASKFKREAEKLRTQLDESQNFATIKKVQSLTGGTYDTYALRRHSKANRLEIQKAEDANYGSVNSYHKDAWLAVYNINLSNINGAA